jgi:hypothetical protein
MHWNNTKVSLYFILVLIITSCNATPTAMPTPKDPRLVDQSFVTGQPCLAPCWYGIEPGHSNEAEMLSKLIELPFINQSKIKKWENVNILGYSNASEVNFECASAGGISCGVVVSVDGMAKYIDLAIRYPLSLKTVIDQLGTPEYMFFTPATPHGDGCRISFNWPQNRISVINNDSSAWQLCQDLQKGKKMGSDLQITEVQYMSEEVALRNPCDKLKCIAWPGFLDK